MEELDRALPAQRLGGHAAGARELAPKLAAALRPGDVAMVKGSLGSRMAEIVQHLLKAERKPALASEV
jgi:UDP-N-acetylmuramoyl-tripeptide--D-alanyl-D-alanine ligase